jgi:hypothetical protein
MASLQEHIESIRLYVEYGADAGSCTMAILENDLVGACRHADMTTRHILFDIVQYLYNHVDARCWGSREKVLEWKRKKREENLSIQTVLEDFE